MMQPMESGDWMSFGVRTSRCVELLS